MYINGHFCYAHKLSLVTNGLGIIRHIAFLDDDFKQDHPELVIEKKSDSPDEDKTIGDSSALQPVLTDFFSLHPDFKPHTFLGDAAFDTIETYAFLKDSCHFSKTLIPWNPRNQSDLPVVGFNAYGYPLCPADDSLPMKRNGVEGKPSVLRRRYHADHNPRPGISAHKNLVWLQNRSYKCKTSAQRSSCFAAKIKLQSNITLFSSTASLGWK